MFLETWWRRRQRQTEFVLPGPLFTALKGNGVDSDGLGSLDFLDFHRRQILSWESIKVFLSRERIDPLGKPQIRTEYWKRKKRMPLVMCQLAKSCLGLQKIWTWPEFQIQHRDVSAAPWNGANGTNPLRRQDVNVSRILPLPTNTRPPNMARIETKRTKTIHS